MITKEVTNVNEWGELISQEITTIKKTSAEEFCQIYLQDNEEFYKLSKAEMNVLSVCWYSSIYYKDDSLNLPGNKIIIDASQRAIIAKKTGLSDGTIKNSIPKLVEKGMLLKDKDFKAVYYLNPKYFFKGRITDRTKLIKHIVIYDLNQ